MRPDLDPVPVPALGRIIAVPAALAHAWALVGLLTGWSVYRVPWLAAVLLVVSAALPAALVVVPRRTGGRLPVRAAVAVVVGLLAVSVAVPALLPPEARSSGQSWNWGTGAMTLLGLAAYVSTARTLVLAALHAGLAAAVQVVSGGGAWRIHLVLVSTLVPPLGAVQYLRFYADALRCRARAVADRRAADAGRQDLDVVRLAGDRRLAALRDEITPLLEHVAGGGPLPLDDGRARQARELAARLRAALVAQRRALWLPQQLGGAPVTVICSDTTAREVGVADRAWLAALLDLLGTHPGWRAAHVVLDARPGGVLAAVVTAEGATAEETTAEETTAEGRTAEGRTAAAATGEPTGAAADVAARAAADPRIRALTDRLGARVDVDGTFLSIDADLRARIGA